jgi:hypothetical protein
VGSDHISYFFGGGRGDIHCSLDKEISWPLAAVGAAVQRAAKLWGSRDISTRTKMRIYSSLLLLVLLYGAETRPIMPSHLMRLEVFHHRCLRNILGVRRSDGISKDELLCRTQQCHIGTAIRRLRLQWLGHVMRMPGERVARQVLFGQLRGTRPVDLPPVSLHSLMRKDVLLLSDGGGQVYGAGINSAWRGMHGGLALIRCYEVFRSLHGLEIDWNGSQGSP